VFGSGGSEVERPVRLVAVLMRDEDAEHLLEMSSAEDQEPVETLGTDSADEALGDRVGLWRPSRSSDDLAAFAAKQRRSCG
jgi:hypothetical protein